MAKLSGYENFRIFTQRKLTILESSGPNQKLLQVRAGAERGLMQVLVLRNLVAFYMNLLLKLSSIYFQMRRALFIWPHEQAQRNDYTLRFENITPCITLIIFTLSEGECPNKNNEVTREFTHGILHTISLMVLQPYTVSSIALLYTHLN